VVNVATWGKILQEKEQQAKYLDKAACFALYILFLV
jgi:hypothetical protein